MDILQWIVIGVLVYVIYYLINKYEQRVSDLTRLIELNREAINHNKENIQKNAQGVAANREKIEKNAEGVSFNREKIVETEQIAKRNKEILDINQDMLSKLK